MKLTNKELLNKFIKWVNDAGEDEDYETVKNAICHVDYDKKKIESEFGPIKYEVCNERGDSGDHDSCMTVIYFEDYETYLGIEGYYGSNSGYNYDEDEWMIMYPKTITKTTYSPFK